MKLYLKVWWLFLLPLLIGYSADAEVYMIKDSRGIVYFTDVPKPSGYVSGTAQVVPVSIGISRDRSRSHYGNLSFSSSYDHIIRESARRWRLDPLLLKAVIKVESDFNRYSVSRKGALGLMQLMPATARDLRVKNSFDPHDNINGGAKYLRKMLDQFDDDLDLALAAYNAGPTAVAKYLGVPPFAETKRYVWKVLRAYDSLQGGKSGSYYAGSGGGSSSNDYRADAVYYSFEDDAGRTVYTDRPVGRKIIAR